MASGSIINNEIVTMDYGIPSTAITAATIGTYGGSASVDVSLSGYTPVAVSLKQIAHPTQYSPTVILNGNTVYFVVYRVTTGAYTIPVNDCVCTVAYKKT